MRKIKTYIFLKSFSKYDCEIQLVFLMAIGNAWNNWKEINLDEHTIFLNVLRLTKKKNKWIHIIKNIKGIKCKTKFQRKEEIKFYWRVLILHAGSTSRIVSVVSFQWKGKNLQPTNALYFFPSVKDNNLY